MPRGTPARYAGLLLLLPMLLPVANTLAPSETQLDFLDVGQGLAVLVGNSNYLLVYDTGPGNGLAGEDRWDMVAGTIQPMIAARGRRPDLIVASHADLDHAGGLGQLRKVYPRSRYLASLPELPAGTGACRAPFSWSAGELEFSVLHPSAGLPYLGNDSSCVISVQGPGLGFLLSGDISRLVEQRLVNEGISKHSVLSVPHHGSSTSSSSVLIKAVDPELALVSAATDNRFDFPRADVLERYKTAHVRIINTADCGGIKINTNAFGGFRIKTARQSRKAIWRWPAGEACP